MTQRSYFRLRLPPEAALNFSSDHGDFAVSELSEGGMRIVCSNESNLCIGQLVSGILTLSSGEVVAVRGFALRKDHNELVIAQVQGVTFSHMMEEQRKLAREFPSIASAAVQTPPATPSI